MDIQLLTNLKLRGAHVGFTEKAQNAVDDWDVECSLLGETSLDTFHAPVPLQHLAAILLLD
jgi:hypothetical protein